MFFFLGIVYHSVKRNDIPSNPFPVTLRSPQSIKLLMHAKFVINVISISNFKVNNSVLKLLHMWSCAVIHVKGVKLDIISTNCKRTRNR